MVVSIIIPFYNRCDTIIDTLISICFQSFFIDNLFDIKIINKNSLNNNFSKIKNYKKIKRKYSNNEIVNFQLKYQILKKIDKNIFIKIVNKLKTTYPFLSNKNEIFFDYEIIIVDDNSNCDLSNSIISFFKGDKNLIIERIKKLNYIYKNLKINLNKIEKVDIIQHVNSFLKHISILKLKENKGVAFARNMGVKKSKGSILFFIDSDDLWCYNKLKVHIFLHLFFKIKKFKIKIYKLIGNNKSDKIVNKKSIKIGFLEDKYNFIIDGKEFINVSYLLRDNNIINPNNERKCPIEGHNVVLLNDEYWYRNAKYVNKPDKFVFDNKLLDKFFDTTIFAISSLSIDKNVINLFKKNFKTVFFNKFLVGEDFDFFLKLVILVNPLIIFNKLNVKNGGNSDQLTKKYKNDIIFNKVEILKSYIKSYYFNNILPEYQVKIIKSYEKYRKILKNYIKF